jgi:hypothetical protein
MKRPNRELITQEAEERAAGIFAARALELLEPEFAKLETGISEHAVWARIIHLLRVDPLALFLSRAS